MLLIDKVDSHQKDAEHGLFVGLFSDGKLSLEAVLLCLLSSWNPENHFWMRTLNNQKSDDRSSITNSHTIDKGRW